MARIIIRLGHFRMGRGRVLQDADEFVLWQDFTIFQRQKKLFNDGQ